MPIPPRPEAANAVGGPGFGTGAINAELLPALPCLFLAETRKHTPPPCWHVIKLY
jgi:hypothetical protein